MSGASGPSEFMRGWRRFYAPGPLLAAAVLIGWLGGLLLYMGGELGISLALASSLLILLSLRRSGELARMHQASLHDALEAAAARNRELQRLQQVSSILLMGESLEDVFREVAAAAADLLQAEGGGIGLVVEEGRFLKIVAATGPLETRIGSLIPADSSLLGWVVAHDEPLTIDDVEADLRHYKLPGVSFTNAALIPLRAAGVVIGTLEVYNRTDGQPFGGHDVQLLQALGDQVVLGLDRAHVLDESRRSEQALAVKNRELLRATELKSQFLANMSHELRTPLNAINGFSDLLLTEELGPINETQREFLDSILRNGKHLLGLINSVLDLSKIEAGRMTLSLTATDLREAITGAVADTASLRTAKLQECKVEIEGAALTVLADDVRVRQVLFNLLSNASKFTPEGGQVILSAVATKAPLPFPGDRAGEKPRLVSREAVWVSVRDTGIGFRPDDTPKLFREFSQADSSASRQAQGTGLGLALCKKFVEMHGGTIGAESVFGLGATFWFILPVEGPLRRTAVAAGAEADSTAVELQRA